MTPRRLLLLGLCCWCTAIAATPLLAAAGIWGVRCSALLYDFFSRVCHQIDSRSYHLAGHKCAVCIRCAAIYWSFLLGALFHRRLSATRVGRIPPSVILPLSLLPMGIDVLLSTFGIHGSNDTTRLATGLVFGFALSLAITSDLEGLVADLLQIAGRGVLSVGTVPYDRTAPAACGSPSQPSFDHQPSGSFAHSQRTTYATKT